MDLFLHDRIIFVRYTIVNMNLEKIIQLRKERIKKKKEGLVLDWQYIYTLHRYNKKSVYGGINKEEVGKNLGFIQ